MTKFVEAIKTHWLTWTLIILTAITIGSLWPIDELPKLPGTDKTHHFVGYALLMLPAAIRKPKNWVILGLFFTAYSGVIELVQPLVNRYGEWMDLFANAGGVFCGVIIGGIINFVISRTKLDLENIEQ